MHNLAFNSLDTVLDKSDHALLEGVHQLRLCQPVRVELRLCDIVEQGVHRDDVTLLELTVVGIVLLHGVISQLHLNLLFRVQIGVEFGILFRACTNVALCILVDLSVG